ncbi:MAG: hypothetical protein F6K59_37610 [Moorea sp. SIO3F7]|nr:hypothetical protein [Moorena sp. SIO3E8]NEQ04314.1 hypothetical protein [Moorena sp. SIO3F7]
MPDSRLPRCVFRRRIKFATGRTAPDSRLPIPYSLFLLLKKIIKSLPHE